MCSSVSFNSSRFSHFGSDPSEALQWPLDSLGVELLWDWCLRKKVLLALKQAGCFKLKRVFKYLASAHSQCSDCRMPQPQICYRAQRQSVQILFWFLSPLTLLRNNTLFLHASFLLTNSIVSLKVMKAKAPELHNQHMAVPFIFNEIYDSKWSDKVPK